MSTVSGTWVAAPPQKRLLRKPKSSGAPAPIFAAVAESSIVRPPPMKFRSRSRALVRTQSTVPKPSPVFAWYFADSTTRTATVAVLESGSTCSVSDASSTVAKLTIGSW